MPHSLPHIITQIRASGRTTTHGAILLAEVDRLTAALVEIRDRAPLDIQEISERIVGKRETANV